MGDDQAEFFIVIRLRVIHRRESGARQTLVGHPKTEAMIGVRILEPILDEFGHVDLAVVALRITRVSAEEPRRILRHTELCVVADDECIFGSRGFKDRIIVPFENNLINNPVRVGSCGTIIVQGHEPDRNGIPGSKAAQVCSRGDVRTISITGRSPTESILAFCDSVTHDGLVRITVCRKCVFSYISIRTAINTDPELTRIPHVCLKGMTMINAQAHLAIGANNVIRARKEIMIRTTATGRTAC